MRSPIHVLQFGAALLMATASASLAAPTTFTRVTAGTFPDQVRWEVRHGETDNGQILTNGLPNSGDALDGSNRLSVDNNGFRSPSGTFDRTGTTTTFGSKSLSGLDVSMNYYFDPITGVMRAFSTFTNASQDSITATIRVSNNLGSDGAGIVSGTSSGDTEWTIADRWFVTDESFAPTSADPALTWVTHGTGNPTLTPFFISDRPSGGSANWRYLLTVEAGQTSNIMWFNMMHKDTVSALAGATLFDTVAPGSSLLTGLSNDQLEQTVNWDFTFDSVPLPGTASLFLFGLIGMLSFRSSKMAHKDMFTVCS